MHFFELDAIGINYYNIRFFIVSEPKYSPPRVMQILKSITKGKIFKEDLRLKTVKGFGTVD